MGKKLIGANHSDNYVNYSFQPRPVKKLVRTGTFVVLSNFTTVIVDQSA